MRQRPGGRTRWRWCWPRAASPTGRSSPPTSRPTRWPGRAPAATPSASCAGSRRAPAHRHLVAAAGDTGRSRPTLREPGAAVAPQPRRRSAAVRRRAVPGGVLPQRAHLLRPRRRGRRSSTASPTGSPPAAPLPRLQRVALAGHRPLPARPPRRRVRLPARADRCRARAGRRGPASAASAAPDAGYARRPPAGPPRGRPGPTAPTAPRRAPTGVELMAGRRGGARPRRPRRGHHRVPQGGLPRPRPPARPPQPRARPRGRRATSRRPGAAYAAALAALDRCDTAAVEATLEGYQLDDARRAARTQGWGGDEDDGALPLRRAGLRLAGRARARGPGGGGADAAPRRPGRASPA